jgi:hypothetical protein
MTLGASSTLLIGIDAPTRAPVYANDVNEGPKVRCLTVSSTYGIIGRELCKEPLTSERQCTFQLCFETLKEYCVSIIWLGHDGVISGFGYKYHLAKRFTSPPHLLRSTWPQNPVPTTQLLSLCDTENQPRRPSHLCGLWTPVGHSPHHYLLNATETIVRTVSVAKT